MADTDISEADDGVEDGDEPTAKKKSKLVLILALAAVLVLGGGGAAAYFLVLAPGDEDSVAEAEAVPEPVPEVPAFVQVDWLVLQTRGDRAPFRNISVLLTLEVDGDDFADAEVAAAMPKLRDAFLLALSEPPLVDSPTARVDTAELKARIADAAAHVLGSDLVRDVLIRNIQDTPA